MLKQCRQVKFNGNMTKWPVQNIQKSTKHVEQQDVTDIKNKLLFVFFLDFPFLFVFLKMISPRNVELLLWYDR